MKIAFVTGSLSDGGAQKVISLLANQMAESNHEVNVVLLSHPKKEVFYKVNDKVKLSFIQANYSKKLFPLKKLRLLKQALNKINADVVISFLPHIDIYTHYALKGQKAIHIVSERCNPYKGSKMFFAHYLKLRVFKKSNGVVFQTQDAKAFYDKYSLKSTKIIRNPLIPLMLNGNYSEKIIVHAGRLETQKNQKMLLDAFKIVVSKHPDYRLKIYGSGNLESELKNYAIKLGVDSKIEFMGSSTTWLQDSLNSRMFVLSSDYEGMPNALIEAMSVGIPSISTDCAIGGSREAIDNGENGILVKVGDVDGLSSKMIDLIEDDELCRKISDNGKKIIEELDVEKIVNSWIEFIEEI